MAKAATEQRVSDPFYDVAGAAAFLGQSERWVRRQVQEGRLPFVRMGRRLAFRESSLEQYIAEHLNAPEDWT